MAAHLRLAIGVAASSLVFALAPVSANALQTVTVTVAGNQFDVTSTQFPYTGNSAKFDLIENGGQMPWWGSAALAAAFANAVAASLGSPNSGSGPSFAYEFIPAVPGFGDRVRVIEYQSGSGTSSQVYAGVFSNFYATAVSTPPPSTSSVPGPLPIFGAAAAFGAARRLRQRIGQGS